MAFLEHFAIFFIIWWIVLFIVLPIGLRTQAEENDVAPGTVESAPARYRPFRTLAATTLISLALYCGWLLASSYFGFSFDDLPQMVPDFG
ncbi:DUF1467 family protein [Rhizobium halophytocola]|uniref:DUF1467 family protein n=1 Tax=Rhizobium halophytocola TaxID=735519 RepID=UPI001AE73560